MKQKNKVGKPIDPRYKFFHYHAEKIIRDDPALKSSEVIKKIKSIRKDIASRDTVLWNDNVCEKYFSIPKAKQPFKIIKNYREKISYINRMIPHLERKLDEITLLLREMNK